MTKTEYHERMNAIISEGTGDIDKKLADLDVEYKKPVIVTIHGETFTQLLEQVADLAKEQGWTHRDARLLKLHDSLVALVETFDE